MQELEKKIKAGVFSGMRYSRIRPTVELVEEFCQDAWLEHLESKCCPIVAGQRVVRRWMSRTDTRQDARFIGLERWDGEYSNEIPWEELEECLRLSRKFPNNERSRKAAARDTQIISLLVEGYSTEGVAVELRTTFNNINTYRRQIKDRLRKILKQNANSSTSQSVV